MSDTPQTDGAEIIRARINPGEKGFDRIVTVDFARKMERDYNALKNGIRIIIIFGIIAAFIILCVIKKIAVYLN